ncbi:MAG: hypothetical protein HRF47_09485 [Chloroflexota bacterium]|jgi:hypothetical protein
MKKTVIWMVVVVMLFVAVEPARAAGPNYCFPTYDPQRCWGLMQVVENLGQRTLAGVAIGILKGFAQIAWLLDRAAAFIFAKSVPENGWLLTIKDQMLNLFAGMMPALLRQIAFGGNGLMYVALSLAGLLMMIPLWGAGARFVRAERVMIWGVLLSLLFTAGSFGYDFIGAVEGFRQSTVSAVAQGSMLPLDKLVLQPMLAGEGDLGFGSDLTALPTVFDSTYFPSPQLAEVTISEGGGFGFGNALVELPEAIHARIVAASQGAFYAFVSLMGGWLLLVTGFAFVVLAFAALLLIVFLFAALPLGFFEVGGLILSGILERYFQVFVQSLTLAVFLRWLAGGLGFIVEVNTVSNALLWLVVLGVMILIAHTFLNGAVRLMMQSGTVFTRTITTAFGGPGLGEMARGAAGRAVAGAAGLAGGAALLMGRPEAALAAGAVGSAARRMGGGASFEGYGLEQTPGQGQPLGNVFVNNGGAGLADMALLAGAAGMARRVQAQTAPQTPAQMPPQTPVQTPQQEQSDPLRAASVFYAAAGQSGWDAAQMQQVQETAQRAGSAQEAVTQLQRLPGFERASSEELRRAVEAARSMRRK